MINVISVFAGMRAAVGSALIALVFILCIIFMVRVPK